MIATIWSFKKMYGDFLWKQFFLMNRMPDSVQQVLAMSLNDDLNVGVSELRQEASHLRLHKWV